MPVLNTTIHMNTTATFVPSARAQAMLNSKRFFTLRGKYILQGEAHPESGEAYFVSFSVDKEGFAKIENKPMQRYGLPTSKQVLEAALKALHELEGRGARIFCDDQDEAFVRSVGMIGH